jgi:hypothetical protein
MVFFGFCFSPVIPKILFHGELLSIGVWRSNKCGCGVVKGWVWLVKGWVWLVTSWSWCCHGRGVSEELNKMCVMRLSGFDSPGGKTESF